jgi:hypothetical protein
MVRGVVFFGGGGKGDRTPPLIVSSHLLGFQFRAHPSIVIKVMILPAVHPCPILPVFRNKSFNLFILAAPDCVRDEVFRPDFGVGAHVVFCGGLVYLVTILSSGINPLQGMDEKGPLFSFHHTMIPAGKRWTAVTSCPSIFHLAWKNTVGRTRSAMVVLASFMAFLVVVVVMGKR